MTNYIMRLDDACEKRDQKNWDRMEELLDRYGVRPLVGIIPRCEDPEMAAYDFDPHFWDTVARWVRKGWVPALHGCTHVYGTACGGLNPVHNRSEFAGEPLDIQAEKIRQGVAVFRAHGMEPSVFFAPSHTFDENTLLALKQESKIRIISDTVAGSPYCRYGMTFVPQQCGRARKLPLGTVTFCYHPNIMKEQDFGQLAAFLDKEAASFIAFPLTESKRPLNLFDKALQFLYFARR